MLLNPTFERAILLSISKEPAGTRISFGKLMRCFPEYTDEQLRDACLKLHDIGAIKVMKTTTVGNSIPSVQFVDGITPSGRNLLRQLEESEF